MYSIVCKHLILLFFFGVPLLWADSALATQGHGGEEGLYSHQIAHLIFLVAMVYLCFQLVRSKDSVQRGWRWIFFSALLFLLWNADALFVHAYREFLGPQNFSGDFFGLPRNFYAESLLDFFYYLGRFDHVLFFPALLFLFLGIRTLKRQQEESR